MKNTIAVHPFLFSVFPVLFLLSHNIEQAQIDQALLPAALILLFTSSLIFLLYLLTKNINKSCIIATLFLLLFFSYGHIHEFMFWNFESFKYRALVWSWLFLFIFGVYKVNKSKSDLKNLSKILNVVSVGLIFISIFNIGLYKISNTSSSIQLNTTAEYDKKIVHTASQSRDIYYIVLDMYASNRVLKEYYSYDNQDFLDFLQENNFYIANSSNSNYLQTILTLASTLNMKYIDNLTDIIGKDSKDALLPSRMVKNNEAMRFLKKNGYKFIHISSGWGPTFQNTYADIDYKLSHVNEFQINLIQTTLLKPYMRKLEFLVGDARNRFYFTMANLKNAFNIEGRKFIFSHIVSPHPPYIFGKNGEPVEDTDLKLHGKVYQEKQNYLNQLIYLNKQLKITIQKILENSTIPPIIILHGDHGTASTFTESTWNNPDVNNLRERSGILSAFYFPDGGDKDLYDSISPVNNFRILFNHYFNADYEILDDRTYYSNYDLPYRFNDITEIISQ